MSTQATTIREVLGRVKSGMAGSREAKQLQEYVEHLTFRPQQLRDGEIHEYCRHCGVQRGELHLSACPAQEVA